MANKLDSNCVQQVIATEQIVDLATNALNGINKNTLKGLDELKKLIPGNNLLVREEDKKSTAIYIWVKVVYSFGGWKLQLVIGESRNVYGGETQVLTELGMPKAKATEAKEILERGW